jgi:uncharacterized protein (DUF433 family)
MHCQLIEGVKNLSKAYTNQNTVVRNSRGLSVSGTRITLYDIMDYLAADWPPALIRNWLNLSEKQMKDATDYIENNRSQVEAEYRIVLQETEEIRRYWEARNQERFERIRSLPPKPGQEKIRAKLKAWKERLEQSC